MDRSRNNSKCAGCTRHGRVCKRDFHTEKEWSLLRRAEDKLSSDIEKNDEELDLLEPELGRLQAHLSELHQRLLEEQKKYLDKQKQYREAMSRQRRLRKQMAFLKQKGFKMSDHDAELLRILDERNGEAQPSVELVQLAASSEDPPSFTQMAETIGRLSPSFWDAFDPSIGGTAEPVGGSPSGAQ